jgi:hypothetical protein
MGLMQLYYANEPDSLDVVTDGTSGATAGVTRVAAKISFEYPELSPLEIKAIIVKSLIHDPLLEGLIKYPGYLDEEKAISLTQHLKKFKQKPEVLEDL